jgi:hypothetical protein
MMARILTRRRANHLLLRCLIVAGITWLLRGSICNAQLAQYVGMYVFAQDSGQQYLGYITHSKYDAESIINDYGTYGNRYSSTSIRNSYSSYGSLYSTYSAYNSLASAPPIIYSYSSVLGYSGQAYLTKNTLKSPRVDPDALIAYLENYSASGWDSGYQDLGGGWRRLSWFGDYVPMGSGWIWHNKHGFFYVLPSNTSQSIFFYAQDMGWLWTSNTTYPYLYRFSDGAWLWYNGSSNPRWFLNMSTWNWESR